MPKAFAHFEQADDKQMLKMDQDHVEVLKSFFFNARRSSYDFP